MKRTVIKLFLFVMFVIVLAASCKGPKECWGVSSDAANDAIEQTTVDDR